MVYVKGALPLFQCSSLRDYIEAPKTLCDRAVTGAPLWVLLCMYGGGGGRERGGGGIEMQVHHE